MVGHVGENEEITGHHMVVLESYSLEAGGHRPLVFLDVLQGVCMFLELSNFLIQLPVDHTGSSWSIRAAQKAQEDFLLGAMRSLHHRVPGRILARFAAGVQ